MVEQNEISADAKAMLKFQSRSKSTGIAYLLWIFLGVFGVHRFYLGSTGVGVLVLLCTLFSLVSAGLTIVGTVVVLIWDLFAIPSQVRAHNEKLLNEIGAN